MEDIFVRLAFNEKVNQQSNCRNKNKGRN